MGIVGNIRFAFDMMFWEQANVNDEEFVPSSALGLGNLTFTLILVAHSRQTLCPADELTTNSKQTLDFVPWQRGKYGISLHGGIGRVRYTKTVT